MDRHVEAVAVISKRVKSFHERGQKFRIYHGSTNTTRATTRNKANVVDTSSLDNVIKVDTVSKTALTEPNVSMEKLLDACLDCGLLPLVVPELKSITVGGAFAGTAGESSSFRYGIFDSTVNTIEVVLADGSVVTASHDSNPDLLYGSGGACGTLGVVTLLEVQLTDAKPYVELQHRPVSSPEDAVQVLESTFDDLTIDFVDGILFSPNNGVILTGQLLSTPPPGMPIRRFTRAHDQHFYRHCEKLLRSKISTDGSKQPTHVTEAVPIRDYLFRYDRGAFWGSKHAFRYFHVPFNRITRTILNPFMHTSVMFHALHESGLASRAIIQDVSFPVHNTCEFIAYAGCVLDCYPLWLCPLRPVAREKVEGGMAGKSFGIGKHAAMDGRYVNVGVWCMAPDASQAEFVRLNREIEGRARELRGLKALYAHTYYTEDEFWEVYDREAHEALRAKYSATGLPSVYEKVKAKESEKKLVSGLYGVWKVITSKEYLLKDKNS